MHAISFQNLQLLKQKRHTKTGMPKKQTIFSYVGITHIRFKGRNSVIFPLSLLAQAPLFELSIAFS